MDLRSMLNPVGEGAAAAAAAAAATAQAQAQAQAQAHLKTPQRTVSLAQPLTTYSSHSPPAQKIPLPRTTSLPAQVTHYRRESTASVSPKTMPPPAPVPFQTPSPVMSRKRSLSHISDHQHTPQPVVKKRRYDPRSPPPWARRERDGHRFVLTPKSEPPNVPVSNNSVTPQPQPQPQPQSQSQTPTNHQSSQPPPTSMSTNHTQQNIPPEHRYEPSIDNNEPYNDMERAICDFLFQNVILQEWRFNSPTKVEIEAKLGSVKDWNDERSRLRLPILTDTVLDPNGPRPKFESSMKIDQHSRLNKYLNSAVQQSQRPERRPIEYKHIRETDYFYDIPQMALHLVDPAVLEYHNRSGKRGAPRLRVTRDNVTNEITAVIIKTRLHDIEVRCPNDEFDFRVSISLETNWTNPGWETFPEHLDHGIRTSRNKDRLSYRHQGYLVDLTQVTPFAKQGEKVDKTHELEIEMDVDRLMEEGYKNLNNQPNQYENLIHVFLNNVKVVNRAAKAPPQMQPPQGPPR